MNHDDVRVLHLPQDELKDNINTKNLLLVLIPGEEVVLYQLKLPKMRYNELIKAIPYALEEQIAENIESLYFFPGKYERDEKLFVATISRTKLDTYLNLLREKAISADVLLPDYLALAYQPQDWTIHIGVERACVRLGKTEGFSIETENLLPVLALYLQRPNEQLPLQILMAQHESFDFLGEIEKLAPNIDIVVIAESEIWNFQDAVTLPPFNLLPTNLRRKRKKIKKIFGWRGVGIIAAVWVFMLFFGKIAQVLQLHYQNKNLDQSINTLVTQIFPNITNTNIDSVNIEPRVQHLLQQLTQASRGDNFIHLLEKIAPILNQHKTVTLGALSYHNKKISLSLSAAGLTDLENLNQSLVQQKLVVKQTEVNSNNKAIKAEWIINE